MEPAPTAGPARSDPPPPPSPPPREPLHLSLLGPMGLLMLVVAFVLRLLGYPDLRAISLLAGMGTLFLVILITLSPDRLARLWDRTFHWSTGYGLNNFVLILAVTGSVILVNRIGQRRSIRFDLTGNKLYTLSDQTVQLLEGLKDRVTARAFCAHVQGSSPEERLAAHQRRTVDDLLTDYARHGGRQIDYALLDPFKEIAAVKEYGVEMNTTVVFEYRGRRVVVAPDRIFTSGDPFSGRPPVFTGEEAFTGALLDLLSGESVTLHMLEGHGERTLDSNQPRNYSNLRKVLERERYRVETVHLVTAPKVPDSCNVLVVAGPHRPLTDIELSRLREYLERPGRGALFLFDYTADGGELLGWTSLMDGLGLELTRLVALEAEPRLHVMPDAPNFFMPQYEPHGLTDPFRKARLPAVVHTAMVLARRKEVPAGVTLTPLLRTTDQGWGESNPDGTVSYTPPMDRPGPVDLGYALERRFDPPIARAPPPGADAPPHDHAPAGVREDPTAPASRTSRIVVLGDADMVADKLQQIVSGSANRDLVMNVLAWLSFRHDRTATIRPRDEERRKIDLVGSQAQMVFNFTVLVYPFLALLLGVAVWSRRAA